MSLPRLKSSFHLVIILCFPMLIFTWGYLSLSSDIRELASRQSILEDALNDFRIFASATHLPPKFENGFVNLGSSLNLSALPRAPDGCSDAVCSNFAPDAASDLLCAKISSARLSEDKKVTPICRFQNGTSRPLYLLRSYPGSGNTWVRQVLERVTGICTGSVYCDRELWLSGMIGEGINSSSVVVVKTHAFETQGDATIFIIRNPIDAIASFWKWYLIFRKIYTEERGTHIHNPPIKYFRNNTGWNRCVKGQMKIWIKLIREQVSLINQPLLIVTYEDMKSNIRREVFRMLDFLKISYSPYEVVEKLKDKATAFQRPRQEFDPYTPQQREFVRSELNKFTKSFKDENMVNIMAGYLSEI